LGGAVFLGESSKTSLAQNLSAPGIKVKWNTVADEIKQDNKVLTPKK
jgi:hypothetical protein